MAKLGIELLPPFIPTGREKIISFWARTIGIPLIIGLQLLFLGLFAFRVKLEIDLRQLAAAVGEKETTQAQAALFEKLFRNTQTKLESIAQSKEELCASCTFEKIYSIKPVLVDITTLALQKEKLNLSAATPQGTSFALFITRILEEDWIRGASLVSGSLNQEGNFSFTLELVIDKEKL